MIDYRDLINEIGKIDLSDHARNIDENSAVRSFRRAVVKLLLDHRASENFKKKCAAQGSPFMEPPKESPISKLYDITPLPASENPICEIPLDQMAEIKAYWPETMEGPVSGEVHDCSTGLPVLDEAAKGMKRGDTISHTGSGNNVGKSMLDEVLKGEQVLFNAMAGLPPGSSDEFWEVVKDMPLGEVVARTSKPSSELLEMFRKAHRSQRDLYSPEVVGSPVIDFDSMEGIEPGTIHDCSTGKPVQVTSVKPLHPPVRPVGSASEGIIPTYKKEYERVVSDSGSDLRLTVVACLGGIGALSPEKYEIALETMAESVGREVDDGFRAEVKEILASLPCPLD